MLALLCFTTPFIGTFGMGTAFVAGLTFIVLGQYVEGAIAIGVVVVNLVGNQMMKSYDLKLSRPLYECPSGNPGRRVFVMWWPFKKTIERRLIRSFEAGLRLIQVSLFTRLRSQYLMTMDKDVASTLAAQVVNYLKGEDIMALMESSTEPLKTQIARIKHQVPDSAANAMAESRSTREAIVGTLRMTATLDFMVKGQSHFQSALHDRILALLSIYGPEFPEEIKPDIYLAMAHRYHQEQFGTSSMDKAKETGK
ncbi:MAG: hypothetical protein WCB12_23470 [Bryobacteraceae bacterium]